MVNTAKVTGRRQLTFNTLDDILADVELLAQGKVRAVGNWSPDCRHCELHLSFLVPEA